MVMKRLRIAKAGRLGASGRSRPKADDSLFDLPIQDRSFASTENRLPSPPCRGRVATTQRSEKINRSWAYGLIHWRNPDGSPLPQIIAGVSDVYALAFDRQENLYALFRSLDHIRVYDLSGRMSRTMRLPCCLPTQMAVGVDGKIYVAGAPSLSVFTPEGKKIPPDIGRDRLNLGDNAAPIGVAVDEDGKIYVGYLGGDIGIYQPDGKLAAPIFRGPRDMVAIGIH